MDNLFCHFRKRKHTQKLFSGLDLINKDDTTFKKDLVTMNNKHFYTKDSNILSFILSANFFLLFIFLILISKSFQSKAKSINY